MNPTGYREVPAPGAAGLVCAWSSALPDGAESFVQRVVPDGCVDLIWWGGGITVAGPDTGPMPAVLRPGDAVAAVRFGPGAAPPVLGVPADALRDGRVPLRELWGGAADRLAEEVASAGGARERREVLVREVAGRVAGPVDPVVPAVLSGLARGSVRDVADAVGLSDRQLRRRSLAAFGYGPKVLQRILRFQRGLRLVRSGRAAAEAAYEAGFADQAHFAHEVRDLAGTPLRGLV